MAAFETLEFDIGGVRTVVKAIGSGKPVLFLHGAATLEGFDFAEGLADRFRVLAPSHPGFGFSGEAPHVAGMADMVLHYLNLLDALDLAEKPHLMGFSMGGWMAVELAALGREKFDKVVLVAPAGLNDPEHPATNLGALAPQDLPGYLAHDVTVALRYFPDGTDIIFAERFGADRAREGETLGRLLAPFGMGHPNLRRFLARITNPALVVWGAEDRLLPASQAPLFVEALPHAQLMIVEDAGHFVMQEKPETLGKIGDFLAG
ncbi:alpha/beta fold hydrolase [Kaistia geumhonensis]|uniref:Pimeloyl-ACP methyl ester carboxylesterase n=1 Tax=Kaistia geumhonensis TaxID=410839 RepID=A0ABU0M526_9HYPH|nr:alpha/beta fold hydrolase [Kaistia geumhonensis]MCX5478713.1 alpha/beta fold hydrolase [Kaistia geumhonensis]MDQ0516069.1 pimeloyl-ACP methyl ester carboxylesterase [Kaistia geumhonensis]